MIRWRGRRDVSWRREPTEVGWGVSRYADGAVLEAGPAALDVTEIFDQLDALDPA